MNNKRKLTGRSFIALLYPDDPLYSSQREVISSKYRFVGILHDRDIDSDGNLKKSHEHIILRLPSGNPTSLKSIADSLFMDYDELRDDSGNLIRLDRCKVQVCSSYRSSCRYLLHADDLDQFQYDISNLFGNEDMIKDVKRFTSSNTLDEKVLELFDMLGFTKLFRIAECEYSQIAETFHKVPETVQDDTLRHFPQDVLCPHCKIMLKAHKPGKFKCSECKNILVIDHRGHICFS